MYTHTPALRNVLFDASAVTPKFIIDEKTMFLSVLGSPPLPQSMTSEVVFFAAEPHSCGHEWPGTAPASVY